MNANKFREKNYAHDEVRKWFILDKSSATESNQSILRVNVAPPTEISVKFNFGGQQGLRLAWLLIFQITEIELNFCTQFYTVSILTSLLALFLNLSLRNWF